MAHIVKAHIALIDRLDGSVATVLRGGMVPQDADPAHLEHLLAHDLVEKAQVVGGLQESRAGDDSGVLDKPRRSRRT